MTLSSLGGIFLLGGANPPGSVGILCVASLSKLNASRLVRDSQGLLCPRLGARTIRRGGRGCVRLQRGAARASWLGLPARVAHPAQGPRRARTGLQPALRAGATAAHLAKHRPAGPAPRAGIQRSTSRDPALGRARRQVPWCGRFIGLLRLKDWLALLGFELTGGRFGCYAPPFSQGRWLERFGFMEKAGDRWWPICGAVYVVRAIKRNVGMRLVRPEWRDKRAAKKALAPVTQRENGLHVEKRERR